MKYAIAALLLLFCLTPVHGQDEPALVYPAALLESGKPTDPELQNLQWNRWTTENFTILSIDNNQGKWLHDNIEQIKAWCMTRWGFPDYKFTKECRIMCVPNKSLLKKLFNLEQASCEVRRKDGVIEISAIWLVLDDKPARTIPVYLTQVCLAEFEAKHNVTIGWWAKRGMSHLNGTLPDIRSQLMSLGTVIGQDQPVYVSEKMFTMTEDDYYKEKVENRKIFDQQAVALCLLLRREFGEAKLQGFLRISSRNSAEDVLRIVYGFSGFGHFDSSYVRYMRDLTSDISQNKTPDSYLEIKAVK